MKVYLVATDTPEGVLYWVGDNDWVYDPVNASWTDDKGLAEMEADQWSDYWAMKGYGKSAYVADFSEAELEP